jgi:hypothetical protein
MHDLQGHSDAVEDHQNRGRELASMASFPLPFPFYIRRGHPVIRIYIIHILPVQPVQMVAVPILHPIEVSNKLDPTLPASAMSDSLLAALSIPIRYTVFRPWSSRFLLEHRRKTRVRDDGAHGRNYPNTLPWWRIGATQFVWPLFAQPGLLAGEKVCFTRVFALPLPLS